MKSRLALCVLSLAACGGPNEVRPTTFGDARPVDLQIPANFDEGKSYPLIVVLHGYSATGFVQEAYFGVKAEQLAGKAFVIAPDGLIDSMGHQFWNADPGCCDFDHTNVDDSGYLSGVIDHIRTAYPIDRVLVIGHSNGGYMAYRLACDHADLLDNIIVLAGDAATDPNACQPVKPVEVLHLHGDADTTVPYAETAMRSVVQWAQHDGCGQTFHPGPTFDLDANAGAETSTEIADGCPTGIDLELWTIAGAGHVPSFNTMAEPTLYQWFLDHPRP